MTIKSFLIFLPADPFGVTTQVIEVPAKRDVSGVLTRQSVAASSSLIDRARRIQAVNADGSLGQMVKWEPQ